MPPYRIQFKIDAPDFASAPDADARSRRDVKQCVSMYL